MKTGIMTRVYVCSPLRGDYEANRKRAIKYCKDVADRGFLPIAPHVYLTTFLDDDDPAQRELGMSMGLELLLMCDELWVYGPEISAGMQAEIEMANKEFIPVRYMNGEYSSRDVPLQVEFMAFKGPWLLDGYFCPNKQCERCISTEYDDTMAYCWYCGQALSWEGVK